MYCVCMFRRGLYVFGCGVKLGRIVLSLCVCWLLVLEMKGFWSVCIALLFVHVYCGIACQFIKVL